ncbi:MAG: endo-1,4-beta-xylanase [Planctomycetes bacterium]|nr:endo-1,4-beta-xylanase [Planctomycetota bacterium]
MRIGVSVLAGAWILGAGLAAHAQTTLRSEAEKRGFLIGCAAWESGTNGHEPAYTETLAREFNLISTRAQLCTGVVQRMRGIYNFEEADKVFDFAHTHQMKVYGHCLVSSQDNSATLPGWIKDGGFSRDELLVILREHLHTVAKRYRDRVAVWNVVNEPIREGCFWRKNVGADWVEQALRFTHEADPNATLLINEFKVERGPADGPKWTQFYALVESMKAQGAPIHAVGLQCYFDRSTAVQDLAHAMKLFADIGVKVYVTELAVRVYTDVPTPQHLQGQAAMYRSVLKTCLEAPNCNAMTVFGVTDKLHWLVLRQGAKESPVLFDRRYQPKPAYYALLDELKKSDDASTQ